MKKKILSALLCIILIVFMIPMGIGLASADEGPNSGNGIINTVPGTSLWGPHGVAVDATGNLYIADSDSNPNQAQSGTPVVPVVGGLAILGIIAALIQKRSYAALLLLLPFRVASIGISSQFVGLAAISLAFDDTKRKPSRVTVDVFKSNGNAIAKGVVVTRGQSTNIGFPVMGMGEKTRLTVKTRGYRNTSRNKSVDIPVR